MKKYIRWLDKWGEEAFVSTMLAFLIGILAIGVFSRFLMNKSFPWVEEVCSYLFIWSSYISMTKFPQVSAALEIDVFYPYLIIPVSMALTAFRTLQTVYRDIKAGTLQYVSKEE